jgi:hypothetical protein
MFSMGRASWNFPPELSSHTHDCIAGGGGARWGGARALRGAHGGLLPRRAGRRGDGQGAGGLTSSTQRGGGGGTTLLKPLLKPLFLLPRRAGRRGDGQGAGGLTSSTQRGGGGGTTLLKPLLKHSTEILWNCFHRWTRGRAVCGWRVAARWWRAGQRESPCSCATGSATRCSRAAPTQCARGARWETAAAARWS